MLCTESQLIPWSYGSVLCERESGGGDSVLGVYNTCVFITHRGCVCAVGAASLCAAASPCESFSHIPQLARRYSLPRPAGNKCYEWLTPAFAQYYSLESCGSGKSGNESKPTTSSAAVFVHAAGVQEAKPIGPNINVCGRCSNMI